MQNIFYIYLHTLSVYTCNVIYVSCFKSKSVTKILFYASFDVSYKTYMKYYYQKNRTESTYLISDINCTRLHNDVTLLQIKIDNKYEFVKVFNRKDFRNASKIYKKMCLGKNFAFYVNI